MYLNLGSRFHRLFLISSLSAVISSCHPWLLHSQQAKEGQPTSTLKVRTSLVIIPTIVADKQGKLVEDLTKDDFIVKEDGKPQTIAFFEHVRTAASSAVKPDLPAGVYTNLVRQDQPSRLTIIAIDARSTGMTERIEARNKIIDFVARNVSLDQPVALLMFDFQGLKVLHDFSTDPRVLVGALKNLQGGKSIPDSTTADVMVSHASYDPRLHSQARWAEEQIAFETDKINLAFQDFGLLQTKAMVYQTLEQFEEIAKAFAGVPGRKSLIWITNGESLSLGDVAAAATISPFMNPKTAAPGQTMEGNLTAGAPMISANVGMQMAPVFERIWRALNGSNIAVYPLDISELASPAFTSPAHMHRSPLTAPTSQLFKMEEIADQTGGTMCDHNASMDDCYRRASHDAEDYYLLAYYVDPANKRKEWRKLDVLVPRREVKIRARSGYMPEGKREENDKLIAGEMLTAMSSPLEYTNLPMQVRMKSFESGDKAPKRKVAFSFMIPPAGNFISQGSYTVDLQFGALASLPDGKPAGQFSRRIAGDLKPEVASQVGVQGLVLDGTIDLAPGEYQIRFVARDNQTGRIGSLTAPVKVEAKTN